MECLKRKILEITIKENTKLWKGKKRKIFQWYGIKKISLMKWNNTLCTNAWGTKNSFEVIDDTNTGKDK